MTPALTAISIRATTKLRATLLANNNCLTVFLLRVHAVFVHTNIVIIKLIAAKVNSGAYAAVLSTNVNVIAIQEVANLKGMDIFRICCRVLRRPGKLAFRTPRIMPNSNPIRPLNDSSTLRPYNAHRAATDPALNAYGLINCEETAHLLLSLIQDARSLNAPRLLVSIEPSTLNKRGRHFWETIDWAISVRAARSFGARKTVDFSQDAIVCKVTSSC